MRLTKPLWASLITVVALFASVYGAALTVGPLIDRANLLHLLAVPLATTVIAVLLVVLHRRFVTREPWSGVRLDWKWSAVPQTLLGVVFAVAAIAVANAVSVAAGFATWLVDWELFREQAGQFALVVLIVILGQAFPEELLFRGHLFGTLSKSLSPRAVLAVTTLVFGSLHILSQSPATGTVEKLLYVVTATCLGFACGAGRARTGAVWMAIGFHTGFHIGIRLFATQDVNYGAQLTLQAAALALSAVAVLAFPAARPAVLQRQRA